MSKIHKPKKDSIVNSHIPIFSLKTNKPGTGLTQQLKALAVFRSDSQYPQDSSPLSITPVPGNMMSSSEFQGTRHAHSTQTCMQTNHSYIYIYM